MNKKILVISNLEKNFLKELYNPVAEKHKKNPEDIVQCTGKTYELGQESVYLTQEQKEKELLKLKKTYYQFFGYGKFANYIIENTGGWKGDEKDINEKIKKFISKEFDDRVFIIDEIQNIKTDKNEELSKSIQPILESIIKYGKNIKLILMSGTPMFDRPDEIIFYINLLLENDGRKKIKKSEIFHSKDGTLKEDAEEKLRNIFKGYVSYIRGEKPFIFPFRIYPKECVVPKTMYYMNGEKIEENKKIKYTKLILCKMESIQLNTYIYYFNKKIKNPKKKILNKKNNNNNNNATDTKKSTKLKKIEELDMNMNNKEESNIDEINTDETNMDETNKKQLGLLDLIKISNIVYPVLENSNHSVNDTINIGSFHKLSIDSEYDNGYGGYYRHIQMIGQKKKIKYRYQSHAIFNKNTIHEAPFADEKHLSKYSTKFSTILNTVKKSKGLIFIFSQFIEQGTLPLALMLEQNGFYRECGEGEEQLLDYQSNKLKKGGKRRPICYLCGNEQNHENHSNEKLKNYHIFKFAKYILYFSESKDIIKIKKDEALKKFCSDKNKYGEEIKIFIGTRSVSEGLDFKRLRQVHIVDPWYNLSRHEQIIGRAIRNHSHKDLLPEEKNVEIYQYASILDETLKLKQNKIRDLLQRETVDLKNYRIAENKDIIIKNIGRIMKESSVDCAFFRNTNIIESNKKVRQITSSGEVLNIDITDKPYSSQCDYKGECNFQCNWMPDKKKNYPINSDTYNLRYSSNNIELIKKYIKEIFRENIVYNLELIEEKIHLKMQNIDKIFIYMALEEMIHNKDEIIYDKFSRKGYLIYRGDYYIFQPFDLDRLSIPYIYRTNPLDIKPENINIENIDVNYEKKEIIKKNVSINTNTLIEKTIDKIKELYDNHLEITKIEKNLKKYIEAIIGLVLDQFNSRELFIFITFILKNYLEKKSFQYMEDFISYLKNNNKLINFYSEIEYNKNKVKNNLYVGFIIHKKYYVLDTVNKQIKINLKNIHFEECSKELINKIKSYKNLKQNIKQTKKHGKLYGIVEYDSLKDVKYFKILDKILEELILTKNKKKSKRSAIKGRMCTTFNIPKLLEIRKRVGLYDMKTKKGINYICNNLEIYFRYQNLIDKNTIWFEDL
jgi:hypothetical protein